MDAPSRRRVLSSLGAAAATTLAGCNGGFSVREAGPTATRTPTATEPPDNPYVTDESVVDYPGMVDGAATVNAGGDAYTIDYEDPQRGFQLDSGFEGATDPGELRVGRDMTVDARVGFVAPVYEENASAFVYLLFANEAFVAYTDWTVATFDAEGDLVSGDSVPFQHLQGNVYGATVTPGEIRRLFVVDATAEAVQRGDTTDLSGIVLLISSPT